MIKDAKSKASRTTNEAVRETFSIKRCQSSIIFKEGESAQRVLALVAVVAAGVPPVLSPGVVPVEVEVLPHSFQTIFVFTMLRVVT